MEVENIVTIHYLPVQDDRKHEKKHEPVFEQDPMLMQDSLVPIRPIRRVAREADHFHIMTSVC
jgi:hypothetical protein